MSWTAEENEKIGIENCENSEFLNDKMYPPAKRKRSESNDQKLPPITKRSVDVENDEVERDEKSAPPNTKEMFNSGDHTSTGDYEENKVDHNNNGTITDERIENGEQTNADREIDQAGVDTASTETTSNDEKSYESRDCRLVYDPQNSQAYDIRVNGEQLSYEQQQQLLQICHLNQQREQLAREQQMRNGKDPENSDQETQQQQQQTTSLATANDLYRSSTPLAHQVVENPIQSPDYEMNGVGEQTNQNGEQMQESVEGSPSGVMSRLQFTHLQQDQCSPDQQPYLQALLLQYHNQRRQAEERELAIQSVDPSIPAASFSDEFYQKVNLQRQHQYLQQHLLQQHQLQQNQQPFLPQQLISQAEMVDATHGGLMGTNGGGDENEAGPSHRHQRQIIYQQQGFPDHISVSSANTHESLKPKNLFYIQHRHHQNHLIYQQLEQSQQLQPQHLQLQHSYQNQDRDGKLIEGEQNFQELKPIDPDQFHQYSNDQLAQQYLVENMQHQQQQQQQLLLEHQQYQLHLTNLDQQQPQQQIPSNHQSIQKSLQQKILLQQAVQDAKQAVKQHELMLINQYNSSPNSSTAANLTALPNATITLPGNLLKRCSSADGKSDDSNIGKSNSEKVNSVNMMNSIFVIWFLI